MPAALRTLVAGFLVVAVHTHAAAQELRITVVDSASRLPLASAVLTWFDAAGAPLGRNITNERGQLSVVLSPVARRLRALRLGYRVRDVPLPRTDEGVATLDIAMVAIPALLEPVTVVAAGNCPRRSDGPTALALLEQARAGLLATIVAREANPATMKLLTYERTMGGTSDRIERQTVRIDSSARRLKSYQAGSTASDFVQNGFARDTDGVRFFYGPDAEVLLDEGFSNGYCFRIADSDGARPNQVGLGFSAADRRKGRTDIEGALWIDTVAHSLKDIDFRYAGIRRVYGEIESGGRVSFREMPNGMVLVDRWFLRLSASRADTTYARGMQVRNWFYARETGGEVARALWPDGRAWKASLGTIQLHVVTGDNKPATSVTVRLADTDYLASPDARGDLEIPDVLPGPYDVTIIDTALAPLGITLGTPLKLYAQRDSTVRARLVEPPPEAFLKAKCARTDAHHWVTARVHRPDGAIVVGADWVLGEELGTAREYVYGSGRTNADGDLGFCGATSISRVLQLRVSDGMQHPRHVVVSIIGDVTKMLIELPARAR